MGLFQLLLLFVVLVGLGLWLWGRLLVGGRWRRSAGWFAGTAVLLLLGTVASWLVGAMAGTSLDPAEACHSAGQTYDEAYRSAHLNETQFFPLHDKCNAGYDMVPGWVNPAVVVLPVLAVACLAYSVRLAVIHRRTKKLPQ
ncbi:hypothetical protein [Streptomyces sp. CB01373]|uniref:hypothetical protein n=1 Tax=Streptomyces sp. CB01373 TaxID=2020325 RepID=UPI000C27E5D2|nr:hypothetical protein [Streptomyces sp. CB01373]PJM94957.1 hypothetical protein CG719_13615 [Streptomyces sp. CB01373]